MRSKSLSESYRAFKKDNFSILQGPPVSHLVPNFNTITYALSYEKQDTQVSPPSDKVPAYTTMNQRFSGYSIAPHLAISLKKVGLGISIANSKRESRFSQSNQYSTGSGLYQQHSIVTASGIGLNLSFLPFEQLRKDYKLAVIAGGRSLNVKHKYSTLQGGYNSVDGISEEDYRTASYTVNTFEMGLNFTMKLMKNFAAIPWLDYSQANIGNAKNTVKDTGDQLGVDPGFEIFQDDLQNFWNADPRIRYGIDLAARMMSFEVRLGSALGAAGNLNSTPEYILDKTFTLSFSFDQSGG